MITTPDDFRPVGGPSATAEGSLTKHSEVSLALGASSSQPVHLAEELPLVREPDVLDDEPGSLLVRSHLDAIAVICVVVGNLLAVIQVEDPRPRAATYGSLQEETQPGHINNTQHFRVKSVEMFACR